MVWQTRATKAIAADTVILFPWTEALSLASEDKPAKRPNWLRPALPFWVDMSTIAPHDEPVGWFLRSPIAGKNMTEAPAMYWTVLEIENEGNMIRKAAVVPFQSPVAQVKGIKKQMRTSTLEAISCNISFLFGGGGMACNLFTFSNRTYVRTYLDVCRAWLLHLYILVR